MGAGARPATCATGRRILRASFGGLLAVYHGPCLSPFLKTKKATVCSQLTRNNLWCFWKLDQLIKNQLFFAHRRSKRSGRAQQQPTSNDPMSSWLGTVVPSSIPESAAWWQVPELF